MLACRMNSRGFKPWSRDTCTSFSTFLAAGLQALNSERDVGQEDSDEPRLGDLPATLHRQLTLSSGSGARPARRSREAGALAVALERRRDDMSSDVAPLVVGLAAAGLLLVLILIVPAIRRLVARTRRMSQRREMDRQHHRSQLDEQASSQELAVPKRRPARCKRNQPAQLPRLKQVLERRPKTGRTPLQRTRPPSKAPASCCPQPTSSCLK